MNIEMLNISMLIFRLFLVAPQQAPRHLREQPQPRRGEARGCRQ